MKKITVIIIFCYLLLLLECGKKILTENSKKFPDGEQNKIAQIFDRFSEYITIDDLDKQMSHISAAYTDSGKSNKNDIKNLLRTMLNNYEILYSHNIVESITIKSNTADVTVNESTKIKHKKNKKILMINQKLTYKLVKAEKNWKIIFAETKK